MKRSFRTQCWQTMRSIFWLWSRSNGQRSRRTRDFEVGFDGNEDLWEASNAGDWLFFWAWLSPSLCSRNSRLVWPSPGQLLRWLRPSTLRTCAALDIKRLPSLELSGGGGKTSANCVESCILDLEQSLYKCRSTLDFWVIWAQDALHFSDHGQGKKTVDFPDWFL